MKSNIYQKLEKLFNVDIITIAKKYNYSEENLLILQNNITSLKEKYPSVYDIINNCSHRRDSRSSIMFFQDLISSWIFEDIVLFNLKKLGLNIELNGNCSQRKILNDNIVNSDSDFIIKNKNNQFHIELVQDYTGFWRKNKLCDLRDNKIKKIEKQKSFLLGIDMLNKSFFFIHHKNLSQQGFMVSSHPVYKKPAFRLKLDNVIFKKFTWENISSEISYFIN